MPDYRLFKPDIFIGIDQTGAVLPNGKVKPLCCSIIKKSKSKLEVHTNLTLQNLDLTSICKLIDVKDLKRTLILADSVLGIPFKDTTNKSLRSLFKEALKYQFNDKKYGANTAYQFFNTIVRKSNTNNIPTRLAERIANANSIFKLKPFQRNIGCGTFRIWKDLAIDQSWYSLWPLEDYTKSTSTIAEGYPSFVWKNFIQGKRGDKDSLIECSEKYQCRIIFADLSKDFNTKDDMDSFALALFAAVNTNLVYKTNFPNEVINKEGWIFGLNYCADQL